MATIAGGIVYEIARRREVRRAEARAGRAARGGASGRAGGRELTPVGGL